MRGSRPIEFGFYHQRCIDPLFRKERNSLCESGGGFTDSVIAEHIICTILHQDTLVL